MPLDPQIRAMLDGLQPEFVDGAAAMTLDQSRALYRREYIEMSSGPAGVVPTLTLPLAGDGARLTVYRPEGSVGELPLILYLHGGGFVLGDTETYAKQSARIAETCRAMVAFLDYRLAPEHPFPAAVDDTIAAVEMLLREGSTLGADMRRFGLMGDSAGGNLAIVALLHFRDTAPFRSATLLYPVADMRPYADLAPFSLSDEAYEAGYYLERAGMAWFSRCYCPDPATTLDPRVSPLLAEDLSGLPPIAIYTGEYDLLRDQGYAFAERLKAAGNAVSYRCFDGLIHNFMQQAGISQASDAAFRAVCADMASALGVQEGS